MARNKNDKITREQCEKDIARLMNQIIKVYKKYNPDGEYLSIAFTNGCNIAVNNSSWDEDMLNPIDFAVLDGKFIHL